MAFDEWNKFPSLNSSRCCPSLVILIARYECSWECAQCGTSVLTLVWRQDPASPDLPSLPALTPYRTPSPLGCIPQGSHSTIPPIEASPLPLCILPRGTPHNASGSCRLSPGPLYRHFLQSTSPHSAQEASKILISSCLTCLKHPEASRAFEKKSSPSWPGTKRPWCQALAIPIFPTRHTFSHSSRTSLATQVTDKGAAI